MCSWSVHWSLRYPYIPDLFTEVSDIHIFLICSLTSQIYRSYWYVTDSAILIYFRTVHCSLSYSFKRASWFFLWRVSAHSDRWVSVHGDWLCFGDRCVSLDVLKKVNMVQGQQDGPLRNLGEMFSLSGVWYWDSQQWTGIEFESAKCWAIGHCSHRWTQPCQDNI